METKCTKQIIERVRPLVESGVTWPRIAIAVGVGESTLRHYRQVDSATYHAEFAAMVKEAVEARDTGKIKAGQFVQAQKHTLKKVTKERKIKTYPHLPPSYYQKDEIIKYADEQLDLILDPKTTIRVMEYEMKLRIDELIEYGEPYVVYEDVIVKIEETDVDPNHAAVKNVLTNTGPKDEKWNFKDEHEHDVTDKLSKLLSEIGSNRSVLPKQDEIPEHKE